MQRRDHSIENYASRAIEGIALSPEEDLLLFPEAGQPDSKLQRLLENMAKVEIGPFAPRPELIAAAIVRLNSIARKAGPPSVSSAASETSP